MRFRRIPFILTGAVVLAIAVATLLPDGQVIYGSLWFKMLWEAIVLSGGAVMWRSRLWRHPVTFSLHISFIVILMGALVTSLTGRRGVLHLRSGVPTDRFLCQGTEGMAKLPCLVRLDSFEILYYPGTDAPRDYVSWLTADGERMAISMNKIGRLHGYRLYQTSYDEDLCGSVLTVNYDPWGTGIIYAGYSLFLISFLISLWRPFFRHVRHSVVLLLLPLCISAKGQELPAITRQKADSMERMQVMWNNRPCPVGTMSMDFLQKIYGKKNYHGLSATQVVASWTLAPRDWNKALIIRIKGKGLCKMDDFIDYSAPTPRLKGMGQDAATDEKVALVLMLQQGTLVKPVPPEVESLSEVRVTTELLYDRIPWTLICIALCALAVVASLIRLRWLCVALKAFVVVFLLTHFVILWYIGGYVPLSNTYETLLFIALCFAPFLPLGSVATLTVALMIERNPQITPLVPVLNSPWLSTHVTCVMLSYALLVVSFFRRQVLRYAVSLLAVGIFLGSVWANVSWGAYWSWDPKEAWALITLIVYSIPLHCEALPWFRKERNYRLYSLIALASLLMTYLGVNYLLGGMHSYG